jgi:hypothetical protein
MRSNFAGSVALLVTGILSPVLWNATPAEAANSYVPFDGEETTWHDGFDRYDYLMDETTFAIAPFKRTMRVSRWRRQTRVASSISSSGKQSELGYEYDTI